MTLLDDRPATTRPAPPTRPALLASVVLGLLLAIAVLAAVHVAQGTAGVGVVDVLAWATGTTDSQAAAVVIDSRLPRLAAGLVVGVALGAAGCVMQSVSRNILASPDTLAVNAGAYLALAVGAGLGWQIGVLGDLGTAFVGGLLAATLVLVLAGTEYGTVRLVLAGTVIALVLRSIATTFLIIRPMEGRGLFAWEAGSLGQNGLAAVAPTTPLVVGCIIALLLLATRLDVMALGDDAARSLGVAVRRTQAVVLLLGVLLSAAAVTVAGPIGFVGLVAPALARLCIARVPGLHRHLALIPVSSLAGVVVVLAADVATRALIGSQRAVEVPTGIVTSVLGGVLLIVFAFRLRARRIGDQSETLEVRGTGTHRVTWLLTSLTVLLLVVCAAAMLIGDATFLLGDLALWVRGQTVGSVDAVLDARAPRVAAALLAGAALAVAGSAIQAVTRNALADPSIIGVAGGASVGAVAVVTFVPGAGFWVLTGAAGLGALAAAGLVFGLAARGGFATDRLVLVGIGTAFVATAAVTLMIVATDPFNASKALTWLSGSTYGRSFEHLVPLGVACVAVVPPLLIAHRRLDLLSIDDDTPRGLGISLPSTRFALLGCAVLLTGTAVAAIGVIGFVGLVAPHAARTLVGRRHRVAVPAAALLGAILVVVADLLARTLFAPTQLPASIFTAIVGCPYFLYLMYRSRPRP